MVGRGAGLLLTYIEFACSAVRKKTVADFHLYLAIIYLSLFYTIIVFRK